MKKTTAVSPRLTRSRTAKSAAVTAIEEISMSKRPRSKSTVAETKRSRAGSKPKDKAGDVIPF
jgi:hypothetical protein